MSNYENGGIPVNSSHFKKGSGLVVKFPSKESLDMTTNAVALSLGEASLLLVSELKKKH